MQLHRVTGVMCGSLAGSSASHGAMACSSIHPSLAIYEGFFAFLDRLSLQGGDGPIRGWHRAAHMRVSAELPGFGLLWFTACTYPTYENLCVSLTAPAVLGFRPECSKYSVGGKCVYSVRTCAFVLEAFYWEKTCAEAEVRVAMVGVGGWANWRPAFTVGVVSRFLLQMVQLHSSHTCVGRKHLRAPRELHR